MTRPVLIFRENTLAACKRLKLIPLTADVSTFILLFFEHKDFYT